VWPVKQKKIEYAHEEALAENARRDDVCDVWGCACCCHNWPQTEPHLHDNTPCQERDSKALTGWEWR